MQATKAQIISEKELVDCLEKIRKEIHTIEFLYNGHVVFLNLDSFYNYLNDLTMMTTGSPSRLRDLIAEIEQFIPMSVSESHMEMFVNAAISGSEEVLHNIEKYFDKVSKINFINSVFQAHSRAAWSEILKICCAMREIKEEEIKND